MIGDYQDDTKTANNLGIDSILIIRGNGWERAVVREPKPTFFITDPLDILKIVDGKFRQNLKIGDVFDIPPLLWSREKWGPK